MALTISLNCDARHDDEAKEDGQKLLRRQRSVAHSTRAKDRNAYQDASPEIIPFRLVQLECLLEGGLLSVCAVRGSAVWRRVVLAIVGGGLGVLLLSIGRRLIRRIVVVVAVLIAVLRLLLVVVGSLAVWGAGCHGCDASSMGSGGGQQGDVEMRRKENRESGARAKATKVSMTPQCAPT